MNGRIAKALRKQAEGDRRKYRALKKFYKEYKFDPKQTEVPF